MMKCPADAISVPGFSADKIHKVGKVPEVEEVASLIHSRRSIRSFVDKSIDRTLLEKVVLLSATAPSGANNQSTQYTVVQDPETLKIVEQYTAEMLQKMSKALHNPIMRPLAKRMLGKQAKAVIKLLPTIDRTIQDHAEGGHFILNQAPALIVFHADPTELAADVNAHLCAENAMIAMTGIGLGGYYSGFVTEAAVQDKRLIDALKIPSDHRVFSVVTVGYPKSAFTRWAEKQNPHITWL
jgi:nitroreductase